VSISLPYFSAEAASSEASDDSEVDEGEWRGESLGETTALESDESVVAAVTCRLRRWGRGRGGGGGGGGGAPQVSPAALVQWLMSNCRAWVRACKWTEGGEEGHEPSRGASSNRRRRKREKKEGGGQGKKSDQPGRTGSSFRESS
jgi:hypothetical protein